MLMNAIVAKKGRRSTSATGAIAVRSPLMIDTPSPEPAPHPALPDEAVWRMAAHWPELATALTEQAVDTVDALLRGLEVLVQRGRLSPAECQVLTTPAQRLKHCAVHAQQIIRFQSGRVRQSHEKIDLAYVVESVLQERRDELALQGITVRRKFKPVELLIDPTLGYGLTQAMLDWSVRLGAHIDLRLDQAHEPPRARLSMKILTAEPPSQAEVFMDNIQWLLLRQIAATDGGIELHREVVADGVALTACFKRVLNAPSSSAELHTADGTPSTVFKTVSGAYVLVCSASPETRLRALGIVKQLGVTADGVASAAQTLAAMRDRDVHLLILDEDSPPADIGQLRHDLAAMYPNLAVLRLVVPRARAKAPKDGDTAVMAEKMKVPVDALEQSLGSAVMFTLSNVI